MTLSSQVHLELPRLFGLLPQPVAITVPRLVICASTWMLATGARLGQGTRILRLLVGNIPQPTLFLRGWFAGIAASRLNVSV
jgi:hypothetical protein